MARMLKSVAIRTEDGIVNNDFKLGFCQLFMVINMLVFGCASCNVVKKKRWGG